MTTIATYPMTGRDGLALRVELQADADTRPSDFESYSPEQVEAWEADEWSYVGLVVIASADGFDLASAAVWGCEYGNLPTVGGSQWVDPVDYHGSYYLPDLVAEATAAARAAIGRIAPLAAA